MKTWLLTLIVLIGHLLRILLSPIAFLLKGLGIRVLDVNYQAIGHLAIEPDIYLKEQMIQKKKQLTILLASRAWNEDTPHQLKVANLFLLECWKEHFCVITNFFLYLLLAPLLKSPLLRYETKHYQVTKLSPFHVKQKEMTRIFNEYNRVVKLEKSSFIKLDDQDLAKGKEKLEQLGIPFGAWYVCFSCRETGHYSLPDDARTRCRNANIANLQLALQEIIKRGGYCIRLGSSLAQPLTSYFEKHPNIIDYPHTNLISPFMDIYLAGTCRFFIGNSSGLSSCVAVLGTPCVLTNIVPFGLRSPFFRDIGIFKLQKSKITNQLLSFSHCLHSILSNSIESEDYEEFQINLIENTPEEICDVVIEMFDHLEGKASLSPEDELLQKHFFSLLTSCNLNYQSPSKVGKAFLKKYSHLI